MRVCVCVCRTSVWQHTVALVSGHVVDAAALVQAGVGATLVDVSLTVRTCSRGED